MLERVNIVAKCNISEPKYSFDLTLSFLWDKKMFRTLMLITHQSETFGCHALYRSQTW